MNMSRCLSIPGRVIAGWQTNIGRRNDEEAGRTAERVALRKVFGPLRGSIKIQEDGGLVDRGLVRKDDAVSLEFFREIARGRFHPVTTDANIWIRQSARNRSNPISLDAVFPDLKKSTIEIEPPAMVRLIKELSTPRLEIFNDLMKVEGNPFAEMLNTLSQPDRIDLIFMSTGEAEAVELVNEYPGTLISGKRELRANMRNCGRMGMMGVPMLEAHWENGGVGEGKKPEPVLPDWGENAPTLLLFHAWDIIKAKGLVPFLGSVLPIILGRPRFAEELLKIGLRVAS